MLQKPEDGTADAKPARHDQAGQNEQERLAVALRRNLLKRKAQSRSRASLEDGKDSDSGA